MKSIYRIFVASLSIVLLSGLSHAQQDTVAIVEQVPQQIVGSPIVLDGDTLLFIYAHLGPFSPQQRAAATNEKLRGIVRAKSVETFDTARVVETLSSSNIVIDSVVVMALTRDDALLAGRTRQELAAEYATLLTRQLYTSLERYSTRSLIVNGGIALGLLVLLALAFWALTMIFPRLYAVLEKWEKRIIPPIRFRSIELISADSITSAAIILAKGIRLAISLALIYAFLTYVLELFPWTRTWDISPILGGVLVWVLVTVAAISLFKGINATFRTLRNRIPAWKGTLIKPVRLKSAEIVSVDRIAEITNGVSRGVQFVALLVLAYLYVTIAFRSFEFTRTWSATLFDYVTTPLWTALMAFVDFLPNIFTIGIIAFVTFNLLKLIRLLFTEIGRGTVSFPGFYPEWAGPTYKIVRFLVLIFATIVIFPYLPGSDSPFFQGISIFVGVLFSLGSSSAIANVVAGVVITYMRPFKIGDRVKIADTMGDIVEKTLLVTRIRTTKNVDITIPNSMVLGSHIINYSSSAREMGLILHTTVTIGYDAPWKKVHELLISAAKDSEYILKVPKPFVVQTSLGDFYVSYQLNVFTSSPNLMEQIYSDLHARIQDKFNEAGVEIMSPHYGAMRDGNRTTIPEDHLPKGYEPQGFRIAPLGNLFGEKKKTGPGKK
ncbi:mechanosensitive ion channel family protein [Sphingobacteriales bacterium CHB3]|nr:mechanosensitive ion channel family protein [Sphingobacteriales bacterium CHB3]